MSCRIHVIDEPGVRVVRVEGRLTDAHAADLLTACLQSHAAVRRVDLSGLSSADAIAAEVLRRLRDEGVELVGTPRYLELILGP